MAQRDKNLAFRILNSMTDWKTSESTDPIAFGPLFDGVRPFDLHYHFQMLADEGCFVNPERLDNNMIVIKPYLLTWRGHNLLELLEQSL